MKAVIYIFHPCKEGIRYLFIAIPSTKYSGYYYYNYYEINPIKRVTHRRANYILNQNPKPMKGCTKMSIDGSRHLKDFPEFDIKKYIRYLEGLLTNCKNDERDKSSIIGINQRLLDELREWQKENLL